MYLFLVLLFSALISKVRCDSLNFTLECHAPNTVLSEANVYIADDYKVYVSNSSSTFNSYVMTNGSLMTNEGLVMGIGKNYLSLDSFSSSFEVASPWTIKDGYLKLFGSDFHAVPSGVDNIYVLGSINAAALRTDVIPVAIKAVDDSGQVVQDYTPSGSDSTSTSVSVIGSKTFNSEGSSSNGVNGLEAASALVSIIFALINWII